MRRRYRFIPDYLDDAYDYGRPAHGCRRGGQHLAGVRLEQLGHVLHAAPFRDQHEQRLAVLAAEHTREAELVDLDPLQDFTALAHAHTAWSTVREGRFSSPANARHILPAIVELEAGQGQAYESVDDLWRELESAVDGPHKAAVADSKP
jgi:hypothetical protein